MKLIPTQPDRTILLLAILYSMAIFVPSAWIEMFGWGGAATANAFLAVFASLIILTATIAGTKRQILTGVSPLLAIAIAWWVSDSYDLTGLTDRRVYRASGEMRELYHGEFVDAAIALSASAAAMFVISFALSFVFDRLIGKVASRSQPLAEIEDGTEAESETKSEIGKKPKGQFRAMAILAACLFVVQISINGVGSRFASQLLGGKVELFAAAIFSIAAFAVACRFSTLKSAGVMLAFTIAIVFAGIQWVAVELKAEVDPTMAATLWVGVFATFMTVWILVGHTKEKADWRPGWLVLIAMGLLGTSIWVHSNYDTGSLLFSLDRFDFGIAKKVKNLDSHPSVRVRMQSQYARRSSCEVVFENGADVDDFFTTNPLPDIPMILTISGMPDSVDLSELEPLTLMAIKIKDSQISTSQLASLTIAQKNTGLQYIYFENCHFVPEQHTWPASIVPRYYLSSVPNGECVNFFDAIKDLAAVEILMSEFGNGSEDAKAIANAINARPGKISLACWQANLALVRELGGSSELSKVQLGSIDFDSADLPMSPDSKKVAAPKLNLLFNSNVNAGVMLASEELFWDLYVGGKAAMQVSWVNDKQVTPRVPVDLDDDSLRDRHFVYDDSRRGDPITKLFLPLFDAEILENISVHRKLQTLSLDNSWSKVNYNFERPDGRIDFSQLNQLTDLRELYLPPWIASWDMAGLSQLKQLETLQINSSTVGFNAANFPKLKHIIIPLLEPPKDQLLVDLAAHEGLEKITLISAIQLGGPSVEQLDETVRLAVPGVEIESVAAIDRQIPEDFLQHVERVRQQCNDKYLK
ncbi:hypothetical protein [Mariniblastus fucicola]|uniref:Uncharacterized protein n=1 Tax=Mariniblastus fucicola TaxID=980251 RepID=A0A5B9P599_9BACT|nr:hypothetical protein [Mariniblastus fucicola]QEG21568.1 hypothetical protein MFFC18_14260 [Mariniblastus fucicola]